MTRFVVRLESYLETRDSLNSNISSGKGASSGSNNAASSSTGLIGA